MSAKTWMNCIFDIIYDGLKKKKFKSLLDYPYVEYPYVKSLLQLSISLIIMFSMKTNEKQADISSKYCTSDTESSAQYVYESAALVYGV